MMLDWLYSAQVAIATSAGVLCLILGLAKRKPSLITLGSIALVELGLLVQLIASIAIVISGARAKNDTIEFFAYLLVALMIPVGAVFWALIERNRWSTVVLAVAGLTVAVMLVRMHQIWTGIY
ncbi:hypothetical protein [Rhodoluna sp.]|uniref:hypothetical protein n=1 Tax=Rhodoluna sp. TaxID=1969481 RepID=UPI0025D7A3FD|nr:hypothetical protein [Rhodoluna sp.]